MKQLRACKMSLKQPQNETRLSLKLTFKSKRDKNQGVTQEGRTLTKIKQPNQPRRQG
jgi:hypothetical protein